MAEATRRGKLRPNSVDSLTGKNSGDNLGEETPVIHFEQWEEDEIEVKLILKGGGCENKNIQYSLPCELDHLGRADRNLEGVRKCILHAVWQAQGQGCAPGALGVCIGSDRAHGYDSGEAAAVPHAGRCESRSRSWPSSKPRSWRRPTGSAWARWASAARSSLIGCKITAANRLPASFFVSVAYDCWAFRRLGVRLDAANGAITQWLYRDPERTVERMAQAEGFPLTGREVVLTAPLTEDAGARAEGRRRGADHGRDVHGPRRRARVPDEESAAGGSARRGAVSLRSGDAEAGRRVDGEGGGPDHQHPRRAVPGDVIERYGVRAVIGKGGMGAKTLAALKEFGAVYLNGIGGAAQYYARTVREGAGRASDGVRHSGSDVASAGEELRGDRHDGRARQQPARGRGAGDGRSAGRRCRTRDAAIW